VIINELFDLSRLLKIGIFKVVVAARATRPPEGLHQNQA
jgi:hypothetical protein